VVSVIRDTIENNPVLLTSPYGHFLAYYDLTAKKWVSRLDSTRRIVTSFNLTDNLIRKFYRSSDGKVWFAMSKEGLGEWKKKNTPYLEYYKNNPADALSLTSNHVYDITEAENNKLWVSTYGGGLQLFDIKNRKWQPAQL
jgi:ligand-binding sensor domain-containing protein